VNYIEAKHNIVISAIVTAEKVGPRRKLLELVNTFNP